MNRLPFLALTVVSLLASTALAAEEPQPPEVSLEGMTLVDKSRRGEIYADEGVDWSVYTAIRLDPATVAFRKNWMRDQNRYNAFKVRSSDMDRIRTDLARQFDEVFSEELTTNGGYALSDQNGDAVMRIEPYIVDLDVHAPDTRNNPGMSRTYTESAGKMTLKLRIYDSVTGDLIASLSDRREAPRRGYLQTANSVTNSAESRRMLQRWAKGLRERLDEARSK